MDKYFVSPKNLVFGSMRMLEYNYPLEYWVTLFNDLYENGVTTFHSSDEYESFPFFCEALSVFQQQHPTKKVKHIVKIAEPHFHVQSFDANLLEEKINTYCLRLNVSKIDVVQWMWRGNLENHQERESLFETFYPKMEQAILQLKSKNTIDQFCCFPYNPEFALAAIQKSQIDGLVVYRNIQEQEYDTALQLAAKLDKKSYVLRPLNAGKALKENNDTPSTLVNWSLDLPNIEGAIVSISSLSKLNEIIKQHV